MTSNQAIFNPQKKRVVFEAEAFEEIELEDRIILRAVQKPAATVLGGICGSVSFDLGLPIGLPDCPLSATCDSLCCGPEKDSKGCWRCLCV